MEKYLKPYNSFWAGVFALLIGLMMMFWPGSILLWMVYFVGILALVGGFAQFFAFLSRTKGVERRWRYLPVSSVIAVIWGITLLVYPSVWIEFAMIFFGVMMVFVSINQLVGLSRMKKRGIKVSGGYFIFPVLLLISGIVVFLNPFASLAWLMIFTGAWIAAYGVIEMFSHFSLKKSSGQGDQ